LAFTNFSVFPNKKDYKSEHIILDKKTLAHDLNKLSFTFVDLEKFDAQRPEDLAALSLEEKFYYFLRHADETKGRDLEKLIGEDRVIGKAYAALDSVYWTEEELLRYDSEDKRERDNRAALVFATQQGKQEGIEEGIKQGKQEGIEEGIEKGIKQGIKKGKQEGIEEGLEKGRQEQNLQIAKNLLQQGFSQEVILKTTGLMQEALAKLRQAK